MGYLSRVCIRTTAAGFAKVADAWDSVEPPQPFAESFSYTCSCGDVRTVVWEDFKWNPGMMACVDAVERVLQDGMGDEPWCFARVGEDPNDWEVLTCDAMREPNNRLERFMLFIDRHIECYDGVPVSPRFGER